MAATPAATASSVRTSKLVCSSATRTPSPTETFNSLASAGFNNTNGAGVRSTMGADDAASSSLPNK